mgnify:CR=1 FL=1
MQFLKFGGGRNFYLKDFRNAYQFRPDVAPPRQKFQGYINFIPNRTLLAQFLGNDNLQLRTRLGSLIRTAQLPELQVQTQVVNQFNRKKTITTGREYAPINLTLFDTIQNEWLTMLMKYFTYQFADATNKFTPDLSNSRSRVLTNVERGVPTRDMDVESLQNGVRQYNTKSAFATDSTKSGYDSNRFGFTQRQTPYFFERIDMILYHGNKGVQYSLANPIITTINFGDIDYADSGFKDITISLQYEYFSVFENLNFDLGEQDLARFENMDGVDLPSLFGKEIRKPIALDETDIKGVMNRGREPQILTQFEGTNNSDEFEAGKNLLMPDANTNVTYSNTPRPEQFVDADGDGKDDNTGETYKEFKKRTDTRSALEKTSDFFTDNPFGRILDRGFSAAVHGADIEDAFTGGVFNEITQAIQNPRAKDPLNGKGKRVDSGSEEEDEST